MPLSPGLNPGWKKSEKKTNKTKYHGFSNIASFVAFDGQL